MPLAERFAELLAGPAERRGLIGPRELPRLWDRHLLNCAVVTELLPSDGTVLDLGSGAGLPGIPIALARPALDVVLLEPAQRRTDFLREVVVDLGLDDRVQVVRQRAETPGGPTALLVVARAVAPLARLAAWARSRTLQGGRLLALKGTSAERELEDANRLPGWERSSARVRECGHGVVEPPTRVVELHRAGSRRAT